MGEINAIKPINNQKNLISFDDEQMSLIKNVIAKGATDNELKLFLYQAQRTGLDPLARQIYFQKFESNTGHSNMSIITSIDGYRLVAARTGKYAGCDDAVFDSEENPKKATVRIYRIVDGMRCGFEATARWSEYYPGDGKKGFMWRKMPCTMLAKVAEALALRKAFPAELSGIYTNDEMDQAKHDSIEPEVVEEKSKPEPKQSPLYLGSPEEQNKMIDFLKSAGVGPEHWDYIHEKMMGKHKSQVAVLIKEIRENESSQPENP